MATSIHVRFAELPRQFTARSWGIRNFNRPFVALPADATFIVPSEECVFVNRPGDRRLQALNLEQAKNWGDDIGEGEDEIMETVFAKAQSGTDLFCLRLVFHADNVYRDTRSNKHQALCRLVDDAKFHATHLPDAEGSMVPIHYGMWLMDTGDWAGMLLVSVTQILVGRTFEALHDYGVYWGGLERSPAGFRHAVIDTNAPGLSREDLLNGKAPCYIVGFSEAEVGHDCARTVPILPLGSYLKPGRIGCAEIADILILLDFMKPRDTGTLSHTWLAFFLYPLWPSVYSGLAVTFEDADEYSKAIIEEMEPDSDHVISLRSDSSSPEPPLSQADTVVANLAVASLEDPEV